MEKEQEGRLIKLELEARQNKRKEEETKTADGNSKSAEESGKESSEQQEDGWVDTKRQAKLETAQGPEPSGEKKNV